MKHLIDRS